MIAGVSQFGPSRPYLMQWDSSASGWPFPTNPFLLIERKMEARHEPLFVLHTVLIGGAAVHVIFVGDGYVFCVQESPVMVRSAEMCRPWHRPSVLSVVTEYSRRRSRRRILGRADGSVFPVTSWYSAVSVDVPMPSVLASLTPSRSSHGASGVAFKCTAKANVVEPILNVPAMPNVTPGPVSPTVSPIWTTSESSVSHVTGFGKRQPVVAFRLAVSVIDNPVVPIFNLPLTVSVRQTSVFGRVTLAGQPCGPVVTSALGASSTSPPEIDRVNVVFVADMDTESLSCLTGPWEISTVGRAMLRLTVLAVLKSGMCPLIVTGPVRQVVVVLFVGLTSLQTSFFSVVGSPTAAWMVTPDFSATVNVHALPVEQ